MTISLHLFEAYLKCPSKCWLRATAEQATGNIYAEWVQAENESYRAAGTKRLLSETPQGEYAISPSAASLRAGKWRLALDVPARTQTLESCLHAVECVPSEVRGESARFIPIRFVFTNKLGKDERLALAFEALTLSETLARKVTQLSYTFRPRRRPKRLRDKRDKYHHSLKALAIREKKIHIVGSPELKIEGTPVYLDVEGLPDHDFYYLIGVRIGDGESVVQHSLWADSVHDEKRIWSEFLDVLSTVKNLVLLHYGSYETMFLKRMSERYGSMPENSAAANAMNSAINLLSVIFAQIYFPTLSNGLKDVAGWLGFNWSDGLSSGLNTISYRERWASSGNLSEKQQLICYNALDCEALSLVTRTILGLNQPQTSSEAASGQKVVDANSLRREHLYGFKRNTFFFPELDSINKAAYWDYQRERVYLKSNRHLRHALRRTCRAMRRIRPNKRVQCPRPPRCPHCVSPAIEKHTKHSKIVHDLKFTAGGIKRWVVQYDFHRYKCRNCGKTFFPQEREWSGGKFGSTMRTWKRSPLFTRRSGKPKWCKHS